VWHVVGCNCVILHKEPLLQQVNCTVY